MMNSYIRKILFKKTTTYNLLNDTGVSLWTLQIVSPSKFPTDNTVNCAKSLSGVCGIELVTMTSVSGYCLTVPPRCGRKHRVRGASVHFSRAERATQFRTSQQSTTGVNHIVQHDANFSFNVTD